LAVQGLCRIFRFGTRRTPAAARRGDLFNHSLTIIVGSKARQINHTYCGRQHIYRERAGAGAL
jgi:hypothetical protein